MKRALMGGAILLLTSCARPVYVATSDAAEGALRGVVKSLRETYLSYPDSIDVLPDSLAAGDTYTIVDYNRAGNIVDQRVFAGRDSTQTTHDEYFYDTDGRQLTRSIEHNRTKGTYRATDYRHDAQGRMAGWRPETGGFRIELKLDRRGYRKLETARADGDGKTIYKIRRRYDRRGRIRTMRSTHGQPTERYRYHREGGLSEVKVGKTESFTYDLHGNLVGSTSLVTERDEKGRRTGKFPATISAHYELFDKQGNWLRRVQYYRGQVVSLTLREIEYY